MIAAAAAAVPSAKQMPFNWFDVVVLVTLIFSVYRGRRNGMAKELLPLLQWLVLVSVCSFLYPLAGQCFINAFHLNKLTSFVCGYITLGFIVLLFFGIVRKLFAERLAKSDLFKGGEYYLGIMSGPLRCMCIFIVALALLNAPVYRQEEIQAHALEVQKNYGGIYSGDYLPTLQEQVFKQSFTGPLVKKYLGALLINSKATPPQWMPKIGG